MVSKLEILNGSTGVGIDRIKIREQAGFKYSYISLTTQLSIKLQLGSYIHACTNETHSLAPLQQINLFPTLVA